MPQSWTGYDTRSIAGFGWIWSNSPQTLRKFQECMQVGSHSTLLCWAELVRLPLGSSLWAPEECPSAWPLSAGTGSILKQADTSTCDTSAMQALLGARLSVLASSFLDHWSGLKSHAPSSGLWCHLLTPRHSLAFLAWVWRGVMAPNSRVNSVLHDWTYAQKFYSHHPIQFTWRLVSLLSPDLHSPGPSSQGFLQPGPGTDR